MSATLTMATAMPDVEQELVNDIQDCAHDPLGFVRYAYPWGEGDLAESAGPWPWQGEILTALGQHLKYPKPRQQPCRIAVSSGHGIGKSALLAQIVSWAPSTCQDCKNVVSANTGTQLAT